MDTERYCLQRRKKFMPVRYTNYYCSVACARITDGNRTKEARENPLWTHWLGMQQRCYLPSNKRYKDYGGRGITVCLAWAAFNNFVADMKEGYKPGLMLERKDNSGNYCKENCTWATNSQQARNRRSNVIVDTPAGKMTLIEASERYNIKYTTLQTRRAAGHSLGFEYAKPFRLKRVLPTQHEQ